MDESRVPSTTLVSFESKLWWFCIKNYKNYVLSTTSVIFKPKLCKFCINSNKLIKNSHITSPSILSIHPNFSLNFPLSSFSFIHPSFYPERTKKNCLNWQHRVIFAYKAISFFTKLNFSFLHAWKRDDFCVCVGAIDMQKWQ